MLPKRLCRALSTFDRSTHRWTDRTLRNAESQVTQRFSLPPHDVHERKLSLVSWNINAFDSRGISRCKLILNHILDGPTSPDIIFFQEVTTDVRDALLYDERVRSCFLATDTEDYKSFDGVPFATMTLLSSNCFTTDPDQILGAGKMMLKGVSRLALPSKYGRDGLCVDIAAPAAPNTVWRLINVHLDSLNTYHWRTQQMELLAGVLREPGCSSGVIAGDFNANSPEDGRLVDKNKLVDAWLALHEGGTGPDGATWGVGVELKDGRNPGRLDKVVMLGLEAEAMEILPPGLIEVPRPAQPSLHSPWSDHCGLRCTFSVK